MQTLIHVYCTKGVSLRERISTDRRLGGSLLAVVKAQQPGRAPGWLKVRSTESSRRGAINVQWDAASAVLSCRIVNRGSGKPNLIVGDFLDFLLANYRRRIRSVTIIPG
jgi:hypothetical protein